MTPIAEPPALAAMPAYYDLLGQRVFALTATTVCPEGDARPVDRAWRGLPAPSRLGGGSGRGKRCPELRYACRRGGPWRRDPRAE